jgi:hypothetical protein
MSPETRLADLLPALAARHRAGELAPATYAAGYFLLWQIARHGERFASRTSKHDPRPEAAGWAEAFGQDSDAALRARLVETFGRYHFLGVIPNVPAALRAWLREEWPLTLTERIPSPAEVLALQAAGTRPVTVVAGYPRCLGPVLGKADGFAFLVHDLEHAHRFFHDPRLHAGQRRLFERLAVAVGRGLFEPYRGDPAFAAKFDYLISDMNTHVVHSLRYLAAILVECLLRREGRVPRDPLSPAGEEELAGLLRGLASLWGFPEPAGAALLRLAGGFTAADAGVLESTILAPAPPVQTFRLPSSSSS